jgi:hypothetical protein
MLNQFKRSIWGTIALIIFSCYLLGGEFMVFSFNGLGNIEFETSNTENISSTISVQSPGNKTQQAPHNHITLSHLYVFNEAPQDTITLVPLYAGTLISTQYLTVSPQRTPLNAHLILSNHNIPDLALSKLSHTLILV